MTTEKIYNKNLGECTYREISRDGSNIFWERVCGNNNIDYVVGIKWKIKQLPTYSNFDIYREKNIALRFYNKEDASSFFSNRIG